MNGHFNAGLQTTTELVSRASICDDFAADCNNAFVHEVQQNLSHSSRSHVWTFVLHNQLSSNNGLIDSLWRANVGQPMSELCHTILRLEAGIAQPQEQALPGYTVHSF
eukprot:3690331-Ditylum_brightwellii.AAC.1